MLNTGVAPRSARRAITPRRQASQITRWRILAAALGVMALLLAGAAWLSYKTNIAKEELESGVGLLPTLQEEITGGEQDRAMATALQLSEHTGAAREAANDPLWALAELFPGLGPNFSAFAEIVRTADDIAKRGIMPIVETTQQTKWQNVFADGKVDTQSIKRAAPNVASAAQTVRISLERLGGITKANLVPQISTPLTTMQQRLKSVQTPLNAAATAMEITPSMAGGDEQRSYLILFQNNAETRASGGIPSAMAVLTFESGIMSLSSQTTANTLGRMDTLIPVEAEQETIYSKRLGMFMQDVNLTPDFPTAAATAKAMWEKKTGQSVDGVISMDPISLGYVLDATGPVKITQPELLELSRGGLPTELSGKNVVQTLLSDVYAKIALPQYQDVYFAGVAKEIFTALSTGGGEGDAWGLIDGISRGAAEGRILLWSAASQEQALIAKYPVSGSVFGPSVAPAQFGVYFNDGTGAKMDFHVKRTVQLVKKCAVDGYEQTAVRITSTNTAPADAATSLPPYVTGAGVFGVPAGSVRTNVIAYGPVQANVETAIVDGEKADFNAQRHANRPVGTVTVTLAPGQSNTVELTFGKIVQHTEPNVVVTPGVQPVKDVILPTENAVCSQ